MSVEEETIDAVNADTQQDTRVRGSRINAADATYGEIVNFLVDEAALLDADRHMEWLGLLAEDISYRMPTRSTLYRRDGRGFDAHGNMFNDNKGMLFMRAQRNIGIKTAYDRDPPPRIRRLITNIAVWQGGVPDEFTVDSSILLMRNRFEDANWDMLTGLREDVVRRTSDGWRLARRVILLDQAVLGNLYMNVFM